MDSDRSWMYKRLKGGLLTPGYAQHAKEFVRFALRRVQIKCPCAKRGCRNTSYRDAEDVELHILKNGFVKGYQVWVFHGEGTVLNPPPLAQLPKNDVEVVYDNEAGDLSSNQRMILDAASPKVVFPVDEAPNAKARKISYARDRYQTELALAEKFQLPGKEDGSSSHEVDHKELLLSHKGVKGHKSSSASYQACPSRCGGSSYSQDQFDQKSVDELVEKRIQAEVNERVAALEKMQEEMLAKIEEQMVAKMRAEIEVKMQVIMDAQVQTHSRVMARLRRYIKKLKAPLPAKYHPPAEDKGDDNDQPPEK